MDILTGLPVWIQVVIAFLVAALLVVMNIGWLIQARGWLQQQGKRRAGGSGTAGTPPAATTKRDGV